MTSTTVHIGLTENNRSSSNSRVLKPPGGGSSDIFGTNNANPVSTPRSVKNHLASNIFSNDNSLKNGNTGDHRRYPSNDSHNRLFGEADRPFTAGKNHLKSNIPIGGSIASDSTDAPVTNGKSTNNGVAHENGDKMNGDIISLNGNGVPKNASGNPVTGEGYKKPPSEINTAVPSLNGAKQVINKNRVPPGGYSSGLW